MIYNQLELQRGKIQIDDELFDFSIINYSSEWTKIHIYNKHNQPFAEHSVPTTAFTNIPFTTGGHRYLLIKPADIYSYTKTT